MTNFESIKAMSIDQLTEWLAQNASWEDSPWAEWFDENYCSKCATEYGTMVDTGRKVKFAWCELHEKCKFFPDLEDIPDDKEIIKMWLEVNYEENSHTI